MYLLRVNNSITAQSSWWDLETGWEPVVSGASVEELQQKAHSLSQNGCVYDIVLTERPDERQWISDPSAFYHRAEKSDSPSVYFDTDGTLCYWYPDGRGFAYPEQILDPAVHYYRDLEAHRYVIELAKHLAKAGVDVCLLGAADYKTIPDKIAWYREFLSFLPKENIFFCPIGADKADYGRQNAQISVLIDDYHKNLDEWEKAGGIAVKLVTRQNTMDLSRFCLPCLENEQCGKDLYYEVARGGVYVKALSSRHSRLLSGGLYQDANDNLYLPTKVLKEMLSRSRGAADFTSLLPSTDVCAVRFLRKEGKTGHQRIFMEADLIGGTRVIPLSPTEQNAILTNHISVRTVEVTKENKEAERTE